MYAPRVLASLNCRQRYPCRTDPTHRNPTAACHLKKHTKAERLHAGHLKHSMAMRPLHLHCQTRLM